MKANIVFVPNPLKADGKPVLANCINGAQGEPGPSGVEEAVSVEIQQQDILQCELIFRGDPVTIEGKLANSSSLSTFGKMVGVAAGPACPLGRVPTILTGRMEHASWNWNKGDLVFLLGSSLSSAVPESGYVQQVGIADGPKVLIVSIRPPIRL